MNWTIIIFAFNEAGSIEATVNSSLAFLSSYASEYELIVVDDGSTDNTPNICSQLLKSHPYLRVIRQNINQGIGMALKTGYNAAQYDFVCALPGDGQFNPEELRAIKPFESDKFYSYYRTSFNYTLYRQLLTTLNRWFNRWFLGLSLRDVNWIKVYKLNQLKLASPKFSSSLIESEICAKLISLGCTPIELPSKYGERKHGVAKGGRWATVKRALKEMPSLYLQSNK